MQVSAVIPTRGRIDRLEKALDSVRKQVGLAPVELIVVDDAANPPLPDLGGDVTVVPFKSPVGACMARNAGVRAAKGDLLLFMDDDAELETTDVLSRSVAWFEARPKLAAVGYRQLTTDGRVHWLQPCGSEVPAVSGMFYSFGCIIRRAAFEHVGGFNELFGYYHEEDELSLKFFAAGYEIIFDPELLVRHHEDLMHRDLTRIYRQKIRNSFIGILQHYPSFSIPAYLARRLKQYSALYGRRYPQLGDLAWISRELIRQSGAIRRTRRSLGWSTIRQFGKLCRDSWENPTPVQRSAL